MAIDIKELFVTDLDAGSGYWWSKEKVDKINYNFTQLSNGGMIGPQGIIGVDGITGDIGPRGTQGPVGDKGPQGPQGDSGINEWEIFPEENGYPGYLFPRKTSETQISPVSLKIGVDEDETSSLNQDPSQTVIVNGTSYTNPNDNVPRVNLRVEHNGTIYGYNFQFLNQENGTNKFKIFPGISTPEFNVIFTAQKILIKSKISLDAADGPIFTDSIIIDSSLIKIGDTVNDTTGLLFNLSNGTNKYTKTEGALEYKKSTDNNIANNVLVSENTNGDLVWKKVRDVFGLFPIGTIISIRLDEFRDEHFDLNEPVNIIEGSRLDNIYGRGRIGTDFEGWYLCNGETWTVSQTGNNIGSQSFLTPNLNNFSYVIGSDGVIQPEINVNNNTNIVLGAYNLEMTAVPNEIGEYLINDTSIRFDNNANFESFNVSSSGQYCESKMIHIVYLDNPNLVWNNISAGINTQTIPTVVTSPVSNIGVSTVTSGGSIVSDGGAAIISKGVVWSTNLNPTITTNQGITINGTGTGSFISTLTNLLQTTNYKVRAYATNSVGTAYGDEVSFAIPLPEVTIGNQIWTSRNLDVDKYRDGTPIPEHVGTTQEWIDLTTGAWCYFNNDPNNGPTYGKLYNWYAVAGIHDNDPNTPNKILAPLGYHMPTSTEWSTLFGYVKSINPIGKLEGKIKSTGTIETGDGLWRAPNTGATNLSGFTGLPGGYRSVGGVFTSRPAAELGPQLNIGYSGVWWHATESILNPATTGVATEVFYRRDDDNLGFAGLFKTNGHSVRLIKDVSPLNTVTIGTQTWTSRNLDIDKFTDDTPIQFVTNATTWKNMRTAAYCYYSYYTPNGLVYGKMYNWYAIAGVVSEESNPPTQIQIAARKRFAPLGYHVPTVAEWQVLATYAGEGSISDEGAAALMTTTGWQTSTPGSGGIVGLNTYGFNGLPGGVISANSGSSSFATQIAWWWCAGEPANQQGTSFVLNCLPGSEDTSMYIYNLARGHGMSVRLIKD